jgi:phosphohistidine phosphatase SixA
LQLLVIVRHGEYNPDTGSISGYGTDQIRKLSIKLQPLIKSVKGSTIILTSPADRARQSAAIIGQVLEITPKEEKILWSDNQHEYDLCGLYKIISALQDEVIIIVTHLEYAEDFPRHFMKKKAGIISDIFQVEKGQAVVIDLRTNTIELI